MQRIIPTFINKQPPFSLKIIVQKMSNFCNHNTDTIFEMMLSLKYMISSLSGVVV